MKILVTGAAGFIGSHLCERLLQNGNEVIGIDNFDPMYDIEIKQKNIAEIKDHPLFTFYTCDIKDEKSLNQACKPHMHEIDTIVHLAAKAGVRPSLIDPAGYENTNVHGTINLLQLASEERIHQMSKGRMIFRPKFIFASSSSVYGDNNQVPFKESDSIESPISPYAATKGACELFCHTYHHLYGLDVWALRFFTVYGPRQRPDLAIHKFTARILKDREINIYGDGTTSRDYTYIDDIVNGILSAIQECKGFEIINLGSETPINLNDMISEIENACGKKAIRNYTYMQMGDVKQTYADIEKAKTLLGYSPKMSFSEGVKQFVDWYKTHKSP